MVARRGAYIARRLFDRVPRALPRRSWRRQQQCLDRLAFRPNDGRPTPVIDWSGGNLDLGPEEATTWSAGIDYEPNFAPWARFSLSYFNIDYSDRIDVPAGGADLPLVLQREDRFPGLVNRNPTAAELLAVLASDSNGVIGNGTGTPFDPATQDLLTVFPNIVLFDDRTNNIAEETARGIDLAFNAAHDTDIGELSFGLNVTYTLEHERRLTPTSPAVDLLNEIGKPVGFRWRANVGWSDGPYGVFATFNYVDEYSNPFDTPATTIEAWTTVDLTLRYDGSEVDGLLHNVTASISVANLFNEDPPEFLDSGTGFRYDPANASAFGRFITLRLGRRW
jgi:iron complex outermembrane recepter protein